MLLFDHPLSARSVVIALILLISSISSCSSSFKKECAWEGFHLGKLRVHVRIDTSDENPDQTSTRSINQSLLDAAGSRASLILISHSRIDLLDQEQSSSCRSAIPEILRSGVIRFRRCTGNLCIAFVDYNAGSCSPTAAH